ncbi:MAG: hypothetical protein R3C16_03625 [Hyphomonadaceae bacterium]
MRRMGGRGGGRAGAADNSELREALERPRAGVVFTAILDLRALAGDAAKRWPPLKPAAAEVDLTDLAHEPDAPITLMAEHADAGDDHRTRVLALRGMAAALYDWLDVNAPDLISEIRPAPIRLSMGGLRSRWPYRHSLVADHLYPFGRESRAAWLRRCAEGGRR